MCVCPTLNHLLAGLTPYEALATATRNSAMYLGTLKSTGTVEVGKRADLVLLAGNPLEDIRQTGRQAGVVDDRFDLMKFWAAPSGARLDSILVTARRVGLPIAGHAPAEDNLKAISMQYASVEHLLGFWGNGRRTQPMKRSSAIPRPRSNKRVCSTTLYQAVKVLHEVGVGLLAGSDVMIAPMPGYLVYQELEALVKAGLTPYEALATATRNPAVYLGTLDSTGTVGVGKRADLVLLAGNPLDDIRQVGRQSGVMLGGRWLPRRELDQTLALLPLPLDMLKNMSKN